MREMRESPMRFTRNRRSRSVMQAARCPPARAGLSLPPGKTPSRLLNQVRQPAAAEIINIATRQQATPSRRGADRRHARRWRRTGNSR